MKPGNFALIIEIHDGHTTPLGVPPPAEWCETQLAHAAKN